MIKLMAKHLSKHMAEKVGYLPENSDNKRTSKFNTKNITKKTVKHIKQ